MRRKLASTALAALAVLLLAGCSRELAPLSPGNEPPVASLAVTPAAGPLPLSLTADSTASFDPDGEVVMRELRLDDGAFRVVGARAELTLSTAGPHLLTLRVTDDRGAVATAQAEVTASASDASTRGFDIELLFSGVDETLEVTFVRAAARWQEVITGDLPAQAVQAAGIEQACGAGRRYGGVIDDLLIFASIAEIDGPGGVVGMAGACALRADGFPVAGVMTLDSADAAALHGSGQLEAVVLHEMGHVLDLNGAAWERRGLLEHDLEDCYRSGSVGFTGAGAGAEFRRLGGQGVVPVEDNGVPGTACTHWDETAFRNELMTGYLDRDMRLSGITVAALGDLGYAVDPAAADDYELPTTGSAVPLSQGEALAELLVPVGGTFDDQGRLHPRSAEPLLELELRRAPHQAPAAPR